MFFVCDGINVPTSSNVEFKTVSVVSFGFVSLGCKNFIVYRFYSVAYACRDVFVFISAIFVNVNG